jgi:hypothetical protein
VTTDWIAESFQEDALLPEQDFAPYIPKTT